MATLAQDTTQSSYAPPQPAPPAEASAPRWHPATRIAFRFFAVYFGLYVVTTQMLGGLVLIPGLGIPPLEALPPVRDIVLWVGNHIFGITHPIAFRTTGSGDKLFNWVHAATLLLVATVGTIVWSIIARRRDNHPRAFAWFRLFWRLSLATTFLSYGFSKVIPLQMPTLALTRLVEPFGNFSPMGVLWYSIGASPAYEMFVGLAEVGAGILLLVPRTAQLGAMMALMDSIAIFTLNMTYDVPVKLFSFHLIVLSLVLAAPNARRIFDLFVLHRNTAIKPEPSLGRSPRAARNVVVAQLVFAVWALGIHAYLGANSWKQFGGGAPKSALYGIWKVEVVSVGGQVRPPLLTDTTRWRYAIFQRPTNMSFQRMNDSLDSYGTVIDTAARTITLTPSNPKRAKSLLSYERPVKGRLIVDGIMDASTIHLELAYRDPESFLQRSRGFHLISEMPFNR